MRKFIALTFVLFVVSGCSSTNFNVPKESPTILLKPNSTCLMQAKKAIGTLEPRKNLQVTHPFKYSNYLRLYANSSKPSSADLTFILYKVKKECFIAKKTGPVLISRTQIDCACVE